MADPTKQSADDRHANVARLLRDTAAADPAAHRVHLGLAMVFLFTLGWSTAPSGIAFALLAVYALLRLPRTNACSKRRHLHGVQD